MAKLSSDLVVEVEDRATGPARAIGRAMDQLERKQRGTNALMRNQERLTAQSAASMGKAQSMALAGVAGYAAPLAAGLGMKEIITQSADFEKALTGIQKKAGLSAAQMQKLGDEVKALATSGDVAVPIEEILGAYERGAAAGLPIDQLREFALMSAKASDAFEMSAQDVGNAAAGFQTAFKIDQGGVNKLFDLINALADSGISDEKDIIDFLDRSGASLKLFGQSQEQAAALGATLLNLKMPAQVASRAMNTLTAKLLAPGSKKAATAMASIVGDTKKFRKLLKTDPNAR